MLKVKLKRWKDIILQKYLTISIFSHFHIFTLWSKKSWSAAGIVWHNSSWFYPLLVSHQQMIWFRRSVFYSSFTTIQNWRDLHKILHDGSPSRRN